MLWHHRVQAREEKYVWTRHARVKMRQYRLTESRIKRIIRHPARAEEGIMPRAIAVMSPAEGQKYSEIWAMYVLTKIKDKSSPRPFLKERGKKIKVITAWRYPGRSPSRDPIPVEILDEIRSLV